MFFQGLFESTVTCFCTFSIPAFPGSRCASRNVEKWSFTASCSSADHFFLMKVLFCFGLRPETTERQASFSAWITYLTICSFSHNGVIKNVLIHRWMNEWTKTYIAHISTQLFFWFFLNAQGAWPMFWPSLVAVSLMSEISAMQPRAQGQLFVTTSRFMHAGYFGVSATHRTLTWITGSL